jgi:adenosylcobyric acid synthase
MKQKKTLRPIMFVGTGSDVGKSIINAAFCRIFLQDGYHPAPFKAQNMSLNSYATPENLEIGRAQAVQAEAAGVPCSSDMNPVLLKPTSDLSSQVVLNGKPVGDQSALEYFMENDSEGLFREAMKAFGRLKEKYNPLVIEGAGSISELNLKDRDITNMRVALETNAAVILVADIDRGGVFGSVYGTIQLLPPDERQLVEGVIINKFRGEMKLFEDGKKMMEDITGVPVVGIIPYFEDIYIEQEDSVVLEKKQRSGQIKKDRINIAVVLLRHMSNFTDFDVFEHLPGVNLVYSAAPEEIVHADIIIIPGSKNTISDMTHLRQAGLAEAIINAHNSGKAVYGVCGGFQMMGQEIRDPLHMEGKVETIQGLGLLPVITTLSPEKTTEQCTFSFLGEDNPCRGYEIHMGETTAQQEQPLCVISDNRKDGYFLNQKTWGTYIHGIFDNQAVIDYILQGNSLKSDTAAFDYQSFKEQQYDKLAHLVRSNTDMDYIYSKIRGD